VTKAILEAAVAARNAALDRGKLASSVQPSTRDSIRPAVQQAGLPSAPVAAGPGVTSGDLQKVQSGMPFVVTLPLPRPSPSPRAVHPIPDVHGLALRDAVRSLHNAGFRVQLTRGGANGSAATSPSAGELAPTGTLVRLLFDF
jgi:cell division protein FtsI (penicillin-binding protein 3)